VQIAVMQRKDLHGLMHEFPLARRKIRAATFRLAFTRAMVAIAAVYTDDAPLSMPEALQEVRARKAAAAARADALREPSKRALASSVGALAERVETLRVEQQEHSAALSEALQAQIAALGEQIRELAAQRERPRRRTRGGTSERPPSQRGLLGLFNQRKHGVTETDTSSFDA
jgi:hypothetical protein